MCRTLWEPLFHVTGTGHCSCTNICPSSHEMPHGHAMNCWVAACQRTASHWNRKLARANSLLCSPETIFSFIPLGEQYFPPGSVISVFTVASCIYEMLVILAVEVILIFRFISMHYIMLSHFLLNLTLMLWHFKTQRQSCLGKGCPIPETQTK